MKWPQFGGITLRSLQFERCTKLKCSRVNAHLLLFPQTDACSKTHTCTRAHTHEHLYKCMQADARIRMVRTHKRAHSLFQSFSHPRSLPPSVSLTYIKTRRPTNTHISVHAHACKPHTHAYGHVPTKKRNARISTHLIIEPRKMNLISESRE